MEDSGDVELDFLVSELIELVQPSAGVQADPEAIWKHVLEQDSKFEWLEATVEKALECARGGEWGLCAYFSARCFKDCQDRSGLDAAMMKLGQLDERCHRTLWLAVADVVLVDIPPGQERLRVLLDHEGSPRWIPTDQLESEILPASGRVVLRGKGSTGPTVLGQLVEKASPETSETGRWAEHFSPGEILELSQLLWQKRLRGPGKDGEGPESRSTPWSATEMRSSGSCKCTPKRNIRCLQLSEEERLRLHQLLVDNCLDQPLEERFDDGASGRGALSHVPGTWYHVLAYPLFGDVTKALLRPAARCWASSQREKAISATQSLGETLVAQCAKAGQWNLVEVLLRHGIGLPDLYREFEKVCGTSEATRRQWRKDWLQVVGPGPTPLLELAAAEDATILGKLLVAIEDAQKEQGKSVECLQLPDLVGGAAGKPPALILRAAEVRRWGVVAVLLSSNLPVAAGQFLASAMAVYCPKGLVYEAEVKELKEAQMKSSNMSQETRLAQYFQQRHVSTVLDAASPPNGFEADGDWLCSTSTKIQVWNKLLHLGVDTGSIQAVVAFLLLSQTESKLLTSTPSAIKTLNLQGKDAALLPAEAGSWLPIFCPRNFLQVSDASSTGFCFEPWNCMPTARFVGSHPLRVSVKTSCCQASLEEFDFCLGSSCVQWFNVGEDGQDLQVRPGQHRLSAPSLGVAPRIVDVAAKLDRGDDVSGGEEKEGEVLLCAGYLFFYVIQEEADKPDALMLTSKLQRIPEEARDFIGKVSFEQQEGYEECDAVIYIRSRFEPLVLPAIFEDVSSTDRKRLGCQAMLQKMKITTSDGQKVDLSEDALKKLSFEEDCCQVKLLRREAAPLKLASLPEPSKTRRLKGPGGHSAPARRATARSSRQATQLKSSMRRGGSRNPQVDPNRAPALVDTSTTGSLRMRGYGTP